MENDDADEDLDAFFQRWEAASEETAMNMRVAEQRPSAKSLGRWLGLYLDLVEATVAVRRDETYIEYRQLGAPIEVLDDAAWWPRRQSPAAEDLDNLIAGGWGSDILREPDDDDQGRVINVLRRLFEAATDHLRGVAILMEDGRAARSPIALTRVAIDAAAHAHHLLEPRIDPSERLIRALNEDLAVMSEAVRDAAREGQTTKTDEEARIDALLSAVRAKLPGHSATWRAGHRPTPENPLGRVPRVGPFVGTGTMIDTALEVTGGHVWAGLSAVAHNQEDTALRVMLALELSKDVRYRDKITSVRVLPAIVVYAAVLDRLGTHLGWDLAGTDMQTLVNVWAVGAGFADDHIRNQLESEDAQAGEHE